MPKLRDPFLCPPLRVDALYALMAIVVRNATGCSNLAHRRAPLIATLEGQRCQRSYDF